MTEPFDPRNRPTEIGIKAGCQVDIGRMNTWDQITVERVERHFGVARQHIDSFFQLPATIESDTGKTYLVVREDTCVLDAFLRNLPKNVVHR